MFVSSLGVEYETKVISQSIIIQKTQIKSNQIKYIHTCHTVQYLPRLVQLHPQYSEVSMTRNFFPPSLVKTSYLLAVSPNAPKADMLMALAAA